MYRIVRFMKKHDGKHREVPAKRRARKKNAATSATKPANEKITISSVAGPPPPDLLFHQAEQEPDIRGLSEYVDSIQLLREKGFSYREIADWFSERGVNVTHNTVYRVFMKNLSDLEAHLEAQRDHDDAQAEAMRNQ